MIDRTTIAYEGVWTTDHRKIEPGALVWPDAPLPVVEWRQAHPTFHYGRPHFIGTMTDIRREDDGRVTAIVDAPAVRGRYVVADLAGLRERRWRSGPMHDAGAIVFTYAEIIGAVTIPIGMWPWPPMHEIQR